MIDSLGYKSPDLTNVAWDSQRLIVPNRQLLIEFCVTGKYTLKLVHVIYE